jgi:hypothetical protein
MTVIIDQKEVEYISDYPDGWKFSAGDPFKFPVFVGDSQCFIKRFEQKTPEDISGWDLLVKMSGKYEKNLSRIYDIKNVTEDDKEIYYVFYEYLDGATLDKYIQEADINLIHLNNDLFNAIRALQKYEFWFADFCEKNIFCQKDGSFILVDVDSTQRIADVPVNDMYGSKDYWILVLKFYKEILNKNDIRLSDINGITLNYLQIPFLVLRLKMILNGDKKDYNSTTLFNKLPSQLNEMAPEFRDIYLNVLKNSKEPLSPETISKIEDIVERRIIKTEYIPEVVVAPVSLPVIKAFTTSSNDIESGGAFTLSWQVENANKLELYKNGAMFKALDISEKEIALTAFADGTRQQSSYQLYAYKDLAMAKSDPIIIKLKDEFKPGPIGPTPPPKKRTGLIIIGVALLVIILGVIFFLNKNPKEPKVTGDILTANAGPDQMIQLPKNTASLDGKGTGPAGTISAYNWTEIPGPHAATITDPNAASTSVTGLGKGTYQFQLKVTDDHSATALDTVKIIVYEGDNVPPVAKAGVNTSAITLPRSDVTLLGSGEDKEGGKITGYAWIKLSGPDNATILNSSSDNTLVTNLTAGTYVFRLTVTDNGGASATDDVKVTVKPAVNIPPTANAGPAQTIGLRRILVKGGPRTTAKLVGTGSSDPDGGALRYEWTLTSQTSTSKVDIQGRNDATAAATGLGIGTYEFQLRVTDAGGLTDSDNTQVIVEYQNQKVPTPKTVNEAIIKRDLPIIRESKKSNILRKKD